MGSLCAVPDGLGSSLGGPAAVSVCVDATSFPQMAFSELLATVQLLGHWGRVSDAFVESPLTSYYYVIIASAFITIVGAS